MSDLYEWLHQTEQDLWCSIEDWITTGEHMMTTVAQAPTQLITGELLTKRVATYLKQSHKETPILVQRCEDGSFLISDRFIMVRVPHHPDFFPYTFFDATWERATFPAKEMVGSEGGPDIQRLWNDFTEDEMQPLTMTHFLWEIAGARNKPGHFYRKLAAYELMEEARETYLDKKFCDMLSPDIDEVEGFLFEQAGKDKPVRVSARNGRVAVLMPLVKNK